jgi:hypothetical protein
MELNVVGAEKKFTTTFETDMSDYCYGVFVQTKPPSLSGLLEKFSF